MEYDFGGYVTVADVKCTDGRRIMHDAFSDQDGTCVPMVWQHCHNDPENVLGKVRLENRPDGVYGYASFNGGAKAAASKELVAHGDVDSFSIFANQLIQRGSDVIHGVIREVSLVLAPANPEARIDNIAFAHADGSVVEDSEEAYISSGLYFDSDSFSHADVSEDSKDDEDKEETYGDILDSMSEEKKTAMAYIIGQLANGDDEDEVEHSDIYHSDGGPTVQDVINSMTKKEKDAFAYVIGTLFGDDNDDDDSDISHSDMEDYMYNNIFDGSGYDADVDQLAHDAFAGAMNYAIQNRTKLSTEYMAHAADYGIQGLEVLFPDAVQVNGNTPEFIGRDSEWVSKILNGIKHVPHSRIKMIYADITEEAARAKGYTKGNRKKEEVFKLLKREIAPTTIYKKQKFDRDDIIDMQQNLDVVPYVRGEMRVMLNEEIARAVVIGDGRTADDQDKVDDTRIIPIATDDALFAIRNVVKPDYVEGTDYTAASGADGKVYTLTDSGWRKLAKAVVDVMPEAMALYRGSGSPVFYTTKKLIISMLRLEDGIGRRLYNSRSELADVLGVKAIEEIDIIAESNVVTVVDGVVIPFIGTVVNLNDYSMGVDRGGEINNFDQFDIDFNQYKYLMETRCSGGLTKPFSALNFFAAGGNLSLNAITYYNEIKGNFEHMTPQLPKDGTTIGKTTVVDQPTVVG